jgi:hypothetical protein
LFPDEPLWEEGKEEGGERHVTVEGAGDTIQNGHYFQDEIED